MDFTCASLETSVWMKTALPPASQIARSAPAPFAVSISATTTDAPSRPNRSAIPRPIPAPAPVTIATLFFNRMLASLFNSEDPFHFAVADSVHAPVQVDRAVVILHDHFDLVAYLYMYRGILDFNRSVLGVQSFYRQTGDSLHRRQPALPADHLAAGVHHQPLSSRLADDRSQYAERDLEIRNHRRIPGVHQKIRTSLVFSNAGECARNRVIARTAATHDFNRNAVRFDQASGLY